MTQPIMHRVQSAVQQQPNKNPSSVSALQPMTSYSHQTDNYRLPAFSPQPMVRHPAQQPSLTVRDSKLVAHPARSATEQEEVNAGDSENIVEDESPLPPVEVDNQDERLDYEAVISRTRKLLLSTRKYRLANSKTKTDVEKSIVSKSLTKRKLQTLRGKRPKSA